MKINFKSLATRQGLTYILLAGCIQLFSTSCSKNESKEQVILPENMEALAVSVLGITEGQEIDLAKKASATKSNAENVNEIKEYNGFDAITSIAEDVSSNTKFIQAEANGATGNGSVKALAMVTGVKYRLLLYSVKNGVETFWRSKEMRSGSTMDTISIVKGGTYKYYAYSYNSSSTMPDATDRTTPTISTGENEDFLYASGTLNTATTGNNTLGLSFARKTIRLSVEFDARGMFTDEIQALTMTVTKGTEPVLQKGVFDIKQGRLVANSTEYYNPTFTLADFVNVEEGFNDRKVVFLYTVVAGVETFDANLKSLRIKLHDNTAVSHDFPAANSKFTFNIPTDNRALGYKYKAKVDLIESAVVVNAAGVANTRWARGNLHYLGASARSNYRFRTQNHGKFTSWDHDYFRFKDSKPGGITLPLTGDLLNSTDGIDPCTLAYPRNTWKTPTTAQWQALAAVTTGRTISTGNHVEYAGVATNAGSPYPSKNLRIGANGWERKGGTGLLYYDEPEEGFYWGFTSDDRMGFHTQRSNIEVRSFGFWGNIAGSLLPNRNHFASIRCVRR